MKFRPKSVEVGEVVICVYPTPLTLGRGRAYTVREVITDPDNFVRIRLAEVYGDRAFGLFRFRKLRRGEAVPAGRIVSDDPPAAPLNRAHENSPAQ